MVKSNKYVPVKVKKKIWKHLIQDARGLIFHRVTEDGQYYVKAAVKEGRIKIEKYYGLTAMVFN